MSVYLFLLILDRVVPGFTHRNPIKRVDREISREHLYGPPQIGFHPAWKYLGPRNGEPAWNWKTPVTSPTGENNGGGMILKGKDSGKGKNIFSDLEILKSIELTFDPKIKVFAPGKEVSKSNKKDGSEAYRNSLLLLTSVTQKQLKKIFEKLEKEVHGRGLADVKNYQTGRFKLYRIKSVPAEA